LSEAGFREDKIHQAALLIIGRLLHPGSERETAWWGREASGLEELLGADFQHLSNNALYRLSDQLIAAKEAIESGLAARERDWFGLREKIILYDLTNSYIEGQAAGSAFARHGHSKEKRTDRPLVTLALVLDEDGFPKASRVFPGNVSEPATLFDLINQLNPLESFSNQRPTVVIDAGISTEDNLARLRLAGYRYICVRLSRPKEIPADGLVVIREDEDRRLQVQK
jgi:hypothetical protein